MFRKSIATALAAATLATAGFAASAGAAAAQSFSVEVGVGTPGYTQVDGRWGRGWEERGGWGRDRGGWDRGRHGHRGHRGGHGWGRGPVQICEPVYVQQPIWRNGYFYGYQTVQTTQCRWSHRR